MSSRQSILARIRANLGKVGDEPTEQEIAPTLAYLKSHPQGPRPMADWTNFSERFMDCAKALGSTAELVPSMTQVPSAVRRFLDANGLPEIGVCWHELVDLRWQDAGIELDARPAEDKDLVGVTGAFCAIAETGTLMLLSGVETAASTSLLPETHIAIVDAARIVKGMEEAWALLRLEHQEMPRAVSFVSGPSRTADIEQTIVIGAHGPYRVHIVVVK